MSDTGPLKRPSVTRLTTPDQGLGRWAGSVTEVLTGLTSPKNDLDRVATQRDLKDLNSFVEKFGAGQRKPNPGDVTIDLGGGYSASVSSDALSKSLMSSPTFMSAMSGGTTAAAPDTPGASVSRGAQIALQGQIDALVLRLGSATGGAAAAGDRNPVICYGAMGAADSNGAPFSFDALANYLVFAAVANLDPSAPATATRFLGIPVASRTSVLVLGDTATLLDPGGPTVTKQWRGSSWAVITGAFQQSSYVTIDPLSGLKYLDNSLWIKPYAQNYPAPLGKMVDALFVLYFSYTTPGPDKEGRPHGLFDLFDNAGFLKTVDSYGNARTFQQIASSTAYIGDTLLHLVQDVSTLRDQTAYIGNLAQQNALKIDALAGRVSTLENQFVSLFATVAYIGDAMWRHGIT